MRAKNFKLGTWQLQTSVAYTPNVYDQSASGAIVSAIGSTAAGSTITLANNDGGRYSLVDTGSTVAGFKTYNLLTTATTTKVADGARSVQVTEAKSGYTSVTTTLPLGVVAPLPTRNWRLASCGGLIPNASRSASSTVATTYQSQLPVYIGSDDQNVIKLTHDNWTLAGQENTGFNSGFTIAKETLHIPSAPIPLVPVTFSGSRSLTLANGDAAITSDPLYPQQFGLTVFPRGMMGWVRSAGTTNGVGSVPQGRYFAAVGGSFCEVGTTQTAAQVDVTSNMSGTGGTSVSQGTGPTAIVGQAVGVSSTATKLGAFHLGDSIIDGLYDTTFATPYGKGFVCRAASDNMGANASAGGTPGSLLAFIQGSHSGDSNWATSAGSTTRVSKYWAYCNVLFTEFGTNDIGSAGTGNAYNIHSGIINTENLFKALVPGGKVIRHTLQPRVTDNGLLSSVTSDGNGTATATIAANGVVLPAVGTVVPSVTIYNSTTTGFNVTASITVTGSTTFTYPIATTVAAGNAAGTVSVGDGGASQYFQTVNSGWGVGGLRDQLVALHKTDLSNGVINGLIDTLAVVTPSGDTTRWLGGYSSEGTHPYQTAGNGAMAVPTRSTLLGLSGLA